MIEAAGFLAELRSRGYTLFTGVPCSHFAGPIQLLAQPGDRTYVPAANEGAALAIAAGAAAAGRKSAVLLQNSGFGNLINPLTSLVATFKLPALVFMSWRGNPDEPPDEPQHRLMGAVTPALLQDLGITPRRLPHDLGRFASLLDELDAELECGRPAFILVERGSIGRAPRSGGPPAAMDRRDVIDVVARHLADQLVVSTTGYLSRELFARLDRDGNFYMQGSMGHAIAFGLGVALSTPSRRVVILDGDGAALMHMGTMSTVGALAPPNLTHVIVNNGGYESTGGQATTADTTELGQVALACGYRSAAVAAERDRFDAAFQASLKSLGPNLVLVRTALAADEAPPRATSQFSPLELRARFSGRARA